LVIRFNGGGKFKFKKRLSTLIQVMREFDLDSSQRSLVEIAYIVRQPFYKQQQQMKDNIAAIFIVALILINSTSSYAQKTADARPNILLIVADDLGYADLGCYGGEIKTPNIDALARKGILFTHFHTSPLCAPTRSMLLSGNDNHVAGMGSMFSVDGTNRAGKPGYERHLTDRIVTIAQLLKDGGYQTFMSGKWHLGSAKDEIPFSKGFEKSFALMNGAANHFNNHPFTPNEPSQYRLDSNQVKYPAGKRINHFSHTWPTPLLTGPCRPLRIISTVIKDDIISDMIHFASFDLPVKKRQVLFRKMLCWEREIRIFVPGLISAQRRKNPNRERWRSMQPW
jgi:hypothetical protein